MRVVKISVCIFDEMASGIAYIQWLLGFSRSYIPPLNSKTSRDIAVTVALIMCGEAPASPPATIVINSSTLAETKTY